jgi:hypothetical protein
MWTYQRVLSFILFFISQVPYGTHCMGWRIGLDVFVWVALWSVVHLQYILRGWEMALLERFQ